MAGAHAESAGARLGVLSMNVTSLYQEDWVQAGNILTV